MDLKTAEEILNSVKNTYSKIAKDFDYTRYDLWPEFEKFLPYIKDKDKILDLGCGNGRLFNLFKNKNIQYLGVDNNAELLKIAAKNHPKAYFREGDLLNIPFENNFFNLIFCIAALHHIPGKKFRHDAVKEMKRVLKPGGIAIVTSWASFHGKYKKYFFKNAWDKISGKSKLDFKDAMIPWARGPLRYYHCFTKGEIQRLFKANGFEVLESYDLFAPREKNLVIIGKK